MGANVRELALFIQLHLMSTFYILNFRRCLIWLWAVRNSILSNSSVPYRFECLVRNIHSRYILQALLPCVTHTHKHFIDVVRHQLLSSVVDKQCGRSTHTAHTTHESHFQFHNNHENKNVSFIRFRYHIAVTNPPRNTNNSRVVVITENGIINIYAYRWNIINQRRW